MGTIETKKSSLNRKMRFFITILALCFATYTLAAQGDCPKASYCQGCTPSGTTCFSCYNYKGGISPKQLAGTSCGTDVANTVTDCKYYLNTISATKSIKDCTMCNSKTWLNIQDNSTAASIVIGCSATAISGSTCAAAVTNCAQSACYKNQSGSYAKLCAQCNTGYVGDSTQTTNVGYAGCTQTGAISNCSMSNPHDKTKCQVCAANYAVSHSNDTSCAAFTTDVNCRKLGDATTFKECKDGYYFDSKTCVLASSIMMFSSMVLSLLVFFN